MYELEIKLERYLRVNLLGPGPRLIKKEFTGPRSHKGWEPLVYIIVLHGIGHSRSFPVQNFNSWTYESIWTFCRTPWTGDQPDSRPLPKRDNTTQHRKTRTHICAANEIWTHDPSVRTVEDITCLRLLGKNTFGLGPLAFSDSETYESLLGHSVGLLGQAISPSQGHYLQRTAQYRKHPCLERDANPRSQCSSGWRPYVL
jgi:hypothetical protein